MSRARRTASSRPITDHRVVIVGGGASGTLVALQLLRQAWQPLEIVLVEPRRNLGRGLAYDTLPTTQVLNVPVGRMSALPDDSEHFARWLARCGAAQVDGRFVPRHVYGLYLEDSLETAVAGARPGVRLRRIAGVAEDLVVGERAVTVRVASTDEAVRADRVLLALGNLPGPGPLPQLVGDPRYVDDPWAAGVFENLNADDVALVLGTGLTMVDVVLTLASLGHRAPLLAVSRHGLLPQAHGPRPAPPGEPLPLLALPPRVSAWLRAVRRAIEDGKGWRECVDGLRRGTPALWARLDSTERRRFLRHLRSYWETARHRMAPEVARAVTELRRQGRLAVRAARVSAVVPSTDDIEVRLDPRGGGEPSLVRVRRVINATGPEMDVTRARSPLVERLLRSGVARPDDLRLGFDATPDGRLIDARGVPSRVVFTLGPPLRGVLWETTAVPEIRRQAATLAAAWLASPPAPAARDNRPPRARAVASSHTRRAARAAEGQE